MGVSLSITKTDGGASLSSVTTDGGVSLFSITTDGGDLSQLKVGGHFLYFEVNR